MSNNSQCARETLTTDYFLFLKQTISSFGTNDCFQPGFSIDLALMQFMAAVISVLKLMRYGTDGAAFKWIKNY